MLPHFCSVGSECFQGPKSVTVSMLKYHVPSGSNSISFPSLIAFINRPQPHNLCQGSRRCAYK
jgi:hypothetical protein